MVKLILCAYLAIPRHGPLRRNALLSLLNMTRLLRAIAGFRLDSNIIKFDFLMLIA
jgi:hypothetical protein